MKKGGRTNQKRKKCETCKGKKAITTYGFGDTVGVEINCPECCDGEVAEIQSGWRPK